MDSRLFVTLVLAPLTAFAYTESPMAAPIVDTSTGPSVNIDNWVPKAVPKPADEAPAAMPSDIVGKSTTPTETPRATPPPVTPATSLVLPTDVPVTKKPTSMPAVVIAPPPPKVMMNEMTGTFSSIDEDAKTFRISATGGFSPQFDYTDQTVVIGKTSSPKVADLNHDDSIIVRYVGKDLIAKEIEVTKKAPR